MPVFRITVEQSSPPLTFIFTMESDCELVEELTGSDNVTFGDVLKDVQQRAQNISCDLNLKDPKITIENV